MENKINIEKKYDSSKLENFLNKVKSRLDSGVEVIGKENENIISNWITEIKENESESFTTKVNIECYEQNISIHDEIKQDILELEQQSESMIEFRFKFSRISNKDITIDEMEKINDFFLNKFPLLKFSEDENLEIIDILKTLELIAFQVQTKWDLAKIMILIYISILQKLNNITTKSSIYIETIFYFVYNNFQKLIKHPEYRLRAEVPKLIKEVIIMDTKHKFSSLDLVNFFFKELMEDIIWNFKLDGDIENPDQDVKTKNVLITLDTSKNILIELINNCRDTKVSILTENILNNFLQFLDNPNRGVRLASYEILQHFIQYLLNIDLNAVKNEPLKSYLSKQFKEKFLLKLSITLSDFYAQVRFSSINCFCVIYQLCIKKLDINLLKEKFFLQLILPGICLNRYLPVEGVKNSSLNLWKEIVGLNGVKILKDNFLFFIDAYLLEMTSKSHLAREAACRCLQEILIKVYEEESHSKIMNKKVNLIFDLIANCIKDACWNVREAALNASGCIYLNFMKYLIEEEMKENILNFYEIVKNHLFENIYEVRDSAAFAFRSLLAGLNESQFLIYDKITNFKSLIQNLIEGLGDENKLNIAFEEFKNKIFEGIKKNTLVPDLGFMREIDRWEYIDGIMHLLKELCEEENVVNVKLGFEYPKLCQIVIDYFCKNYNTLDNFTKKTIWGVLNSIFRKLKKNDIEIYLELIGEFLVKEIKSKIFLLICNIRSFE